MTALTGNRFTRRGLLRAGAVVAAVGAGWSAALARVSAAPRFRTVYYLDPDCASDECHNGGDEISKHSCNVCQACINHAKNKRWADQNAIKRAHDCCRCSENEMLVPLALFNRMFGTGSDAEPEFDRRRGFVH